MYLSMIWQLKNKEGIEVHKILGDGACLFRAVAYVLYRDEERHREVRKRCLDFVEEHSGLFKNFIESEEDFDNYVARMREPDAHGGHIELHAIARCFGMNLLIYRYSASDPLLIPCCSTKITDDIDATRATDNIRLIYTFVNRPDLITGSLTEVGHYDCAISTTNQLGIDAAPKQNPVNGSTEGILIARLIVYIPWQAFQ